MQRSITFAALAVLLAASLAMTTQANQAYAYKSDYVDGQRFINGHYVPGTVSVHGHVLTEVYQCTWFVDGCDLSWIPAELIDWLKTTHNYKNGNLWILNE